MTERFYLVTFDLLNSKNRTNEYAIARQALKFRFGANNFWRIVKQCCIVRTDQNASAIRDVLSQRLGKNCNILVVRLARGYAFRMATPGLGGFAKECLDQIP